MTDEEFLLRTVAALASHQQNDATLGATKYLLFQIVSCATEALSYPAGSVDYADAMVALQEAVRTIYPLA